MCEFHPQIVDGQPAIPVCPICGNPVDNPASAIRRGGDFYHQDCWEEYCEELEIELDKEPPHASR